MSGSGLGVSARRRRMSWQTCSGRRREESQFPLTLATFETIRREGKMPDKVTYYAIVTHRSSRERPAGVLRRTYLDAGGRRDEAFTRDLAWERSSSFASAERGDLQNEFIEISEEEAERIVARIRAAVTGSADA
jgi:hypothetical protein